MLRINLIRWASKIALVALLSISACQIKEDQVAPEPDETDVYSSVRRDLQLVAPAMARLLSDPEVRLLIKTEAMKQFDGDYDILYRHIRDSKLADGKTFGERLAAEVVASPDCRYKIPQILDGIPKFQISVPVHCEAWNAETDIPLVVAEPYGIEEKDRTVVYGHDGTGSPVSISTETDPGRPIVVVGVSERTNEDGIMYHHILSSLVDSSFSSRLNGEVEKLYTFRLHDLNWWEEWINGKPELRVYYLSVSGSGQTAPTANAPSKFYTFDRSELNNDQWKVVNTQLFSWVVEPVTSYTTTISDRYRIFWFEEDNGTVTTQTLGMPASTIKLITGGAEVTVPITPSNTFSITRTDKDEYAGSADIWFEESKSTTYSTGSQCDFIMN